MCNAKIWTKTFKTIIVALALVSSVTASFAQVWPKLIWIVIAMVGARSAAMAFNRVIDADIDGRNADGASPAHRDAR